MEMKTVLLVAFGLAVVLPYVTVALLQGGGQIGIYVMTGIFLAAIALVVISDIRDGGDRTRTEDT